MRITNRSLSAQEFLNLRAAVGWPESDEESTRTALLNSLCSVVAEENEAVIGFGRVIGDGGLYFYVQDVIVHPDHQGKGVGTALMAALLDFIGSAARRGAFIGLMAASGRSAFYERFGFRMRSPDAPGMCLKWK